ncbi:MAG: hypothetical protein QW412_03565, partial [Candidatus Aenigmatarchaeota archaeon]
KGLYERLVGEEKELEGKIKETKEIIEKISSVVGKCPLCDSILTEDKKEKLLKEREKLLEEFNKRIEETRKNKDENEKELKELEKIGKKVESIIGEIKDLDIKKEEYENSKKQLEDLSKNFGEKEEKLKKLKEEIGEIEKVSEEVREKINELKILYSKFEDYEKRKERLSELMKEAKHLEAKISEVEEKISGRNLVEKETKLRELFGEEKEKEEKISGISKLIEEKEQRKKEYEERLKELIKEKEEVKKLEKIISDLKIFELALKSTQEEMRREFVEAVNYEMNKLWPTLYPYRDFIEIKLNIEEGDYVLQLKDRAGRFINADGIASGGERSVACLALRIAFARVLAPQLRWLVLDEPTQNLDVKAVEDLALTLKTRVGELVDQVFLISHEERLEDAVTGFLYRLERDKEKDEPTKVIAIS